MTFKRTERVGNLIKKELGLILQRRAEELGTKSVVVTHVKVSTDLTYAKVYVLSYNISNSSQSTEKNNLLKMLNEVSPYLQKLLAQRISLRKTPKPQFVYDESVPRAQELTKVIDAAIAADAES